METTGIDAKLQAGITLIKGAVLLLVYLPKATNQLLLVLLVAMGYWTLVFCRKSHLEQQPREDTERKTETDATLQLQQELETLQQVHSSIKALHHMTVTLHTTLQSVVRNSNELTDLNEGWKIFFGQSSA
ncbi:hypothetical protein XELAEV_18013690mg [Xenopus laevis]|uniref:Uncharacterized protein n=1 Tax=Xenopus laevis TaxID=8355 RepID=A0A974DQ45_XENLA|nr:hypothetical protein XELAEV_18013690mg [Xenopus laevis]